MVAPWESLRIAAKQYPDVKKEKEKRDNTVFLRSASLFSIPFVYPAKIVTEGLPHTS